MGDHGIAVLEARGELGFESGIQSDVAPLNHLIEAVLDVSEQVYVLRDPISAGAPTTLNEIAGQSHVSIVLDEASSPVHPAVDTACEMLSFDPPYVANEGKVIVMVARGDADKFLRVLHSTRYGERQSSSARCGPSRRTVC